VISDDPDDTSLVVVEMDTPDPQDKNAVNDAIQQAMLEVLSVHQRLTSGDYLRKCKLVEVNGTPINDSAFYRNLKILRSCGLIKQETEENAPTKKGVKVWYSLPN